MTWTYDGIRIYPNKHDAKKEKVIARLQPLSGTTILHIFGNNKKIVTLEGLVVTEADKNHLEAIVESGVAYTLSGPEGIVGSYIAHNIDAKRSEITWIKLFDRPGLDCYSPVYSVTMELY